MKRKVELLAPAGSFEALIAAVQNGADAIYMGGSEFSARAYASNFDREKILEAIEYAHIRDVRIFVAVNALIKDSEIDKLLEYINFLYNADVDALIVQDLGVLKIIRELYPDFEIHCSTQMTLHNSYGVNLLKTLGAKRVVLARELSLKDIKDIYKNTGIELEVFVHGALCVSYSGQCLMSSLIGGRSGNRGKCAQPCRKPYELLATNGEKGSEPFYYLSMRDLNTLENIPLLIDSGVKSFKIEGRMKKPQYVAAIVGAYRRAIDSYINSGKGLIDENTNKQVTQIFNRKFTKGYLFNEKGNSVINIHKPNNSGVYLGLVKLANKKNNRFSIYLEDDIFHGDGVEVWGSKEEVGGIVNKIYKNGRLTHEAKKGELVEIELKGNIKIGEEVYKTLDNRLLRNLEKTYEHNLENKKVDMFGTAIIKIGSPMELSIEDYKGSKVSVKGNTIVEKAHKVALTEDKVINSLSKLNNTPFTLEYINIDLDEGAVLPLSAINELRREAISRLTDLKKNINKRTDSPLKVLPYKEGSNFRRLDSIDLNIKVDTIEQLRQVLRYSINRIYFSDIDKLALAVELCKEKNIPIYLKTPNIVKDTEFHIFNEAIKRNKLDGVLVGDLGMIRFIQENFKGLNIITDMSLNHFNSISINQGMELGVQGITLSVEMDLKSMQSLHINNDLEIECIVYGRTPVMTTNYCPLINLNYCNKRCESCLQSKYMLNWSIKDEKGYAFPISRDALGRTVIYNSHPIFMGDKLDSFNNSIFNSIRIEITDESLERISELIEIYLKKNDFNQKELDFKFTRGHFYRDID